MGWSLTLDGLLHRLVIDMGCSLNCDCDNSRSQSYYFCIFCKLNFIDSYIMSILKHGDKLPILFTGPNSLLAPNKHVLYGDS